MFYCMISVDTFSINTGSVHLPLTFTCTKLNYTSIQLHTCGLFVCVVCCVCVCGLAPSRGFTIESKNENKYGHTMRDVMNYNRLMQFMMQSQSESGIRVIAICDRQNNSESKMVALTFDDGKVKDRLSRKLMFGFVHTLFD